MNEIMLSQHIDFDSKKQHMVSLTKYTVHFCLVFLVTTVFLALPVSSKDIETVGLLAGVGGLGDQSYNDTTFAGLAQAQKKYSFTLIFEETTSSEKSQIEGLEKLLSRGADIIVVNGSGLEKLIEEYAPRLPEKYFVVNDNAIHDQKNVVSILFQNQEGAYLVGVLAALMSEAGSIGFIGGVDLPAIRSFESGFIKGAAKVSSKVQVTSVFVSKNGDLSGFNSPDLGYQLAGEMYGKGVDIIFAAAGLTGNGVIEAARRHRQLVIGVDSNQDHMAKGTVLTSMMKRLDRVTYKEIASILEGSFEPGIRYYGLKDGEISLTPMHYTKHLVPEETLKLLQQVQKDIINGKITIDTSIPMVKEN